MNIRPGTVHRLSIVALVALLASVVTTHAADTTLGAPFARKVLVPPGEAPLSLRFFSTAVKTDSRGRIITGPTSDPVKRIVGAEPAGERAGLERYTKIMFGADYLDGRPDPGTRIDPNAPRVNSGSQYWPFIPQPFRSWPTALALTPDDRKLYVALPGREGYPDHRVAVVDAATRRVLRWVDLRPSGQPESTRPSGIQVSPLNAAIFARPYVVVLNQYANFASVIDTGNDAVLGQFETGFYAEDAIFNAAGTRLYVTDRFGDRVHAFRVDSGPRFTRLASVATGSTDLERTNPRDLALGADGRTLYVGNTLGHSVAVIDVASDVPRLVRTMPVGGLVTDVKVAGRWGIVTGHASNSFMNQPERGHGLPKKVGGQWIRNSGAALGYTPVMDDATRATTFDDIGSEINVFDTTTNQFVYRYVDVGRDQSMMASPGRTIDLGDHETGQEIIRGSGPEQAFVRGPFLFVAHMHSEQVEVFRINQAPASAAGVLAHVGVQLTGGITPQGLAVSSDGRTLWVANMQTEDVSCLTVDAAGRLTRAGLVTVGVTGSTPDPTRGGNGQNLFATAEEQGLRWFFSSAYSDDGQKSCNNCHWQSRSDGSQWNVGANAIGGVKNCPQNKDISDNWPEWYEGLNNDMMAYASACNGELTIAENPTTLFPQQSQEDRFRARNDFVRSRTAANSSSLGRRDLSGSAYSLDYYELAYLQILWSQNETRRMPNPLSQFPSASEASMVARGRDLFTRKVAQGGAGCADCHHNGNVVTNGAVDDTFQDYNIHEPGVVSETTVDGDGPFYRPQNEYFFGELDPPQDEGIPQNLSSRNTKHLRAFWDSTPRWLHHGAAHSLRELLLPPDSPLLRAGERGFNFRTVRADHSRAVAEDYLGRPPLVLPTEVPVTVADRSGALGGDGMGPILVSIDSPRVTLPDGSLQIDRVGTSSLLPLLTPGTRQINPALATNGVRVLKDTHGKTSHLGAADFDALSLYLLSLE